MLNLSPHRALTISFLFAGDIDIWLCIQQQFLTKIKKTMASLNISLVLAAKITQVEFTNKSLEFEYKIAARSR